MERMQDLLEKDKEKLIGELRKQPNPEKAQKVLEDQVDRCLYLYNEQEEEEQIRTEAARMLQMIKASCAFVDTIGQTKIWEKSVSETTAEEKKTDQATLLGAAGLILAAVTAAILLLTNENAGVAQVLICLFFLTVSLLLVYRSGITKKNGSAEKAKREQYTENLVDAAKLYRLLHASFLQVDQELDQIRLWSGYEKARNGESVSGEEGVSEEELALMADLLEASCSGDGEYALEKLEQLKFYLHRKQIDTVDYGEGTRAYFDVMPSRNSGTIRPAMLRNGKLLKKGLAAGGM
ncbi:MAG: hypothetical protein IIY55_04175 [Blautia sp.]|nr:hypothetical protein [Blautia sp.]